MPLSVVFFLGFLAVERQSEGNKRRKRREETEEEEGKEEDEYSE